MTRNLNAQSIRQYCLEKSGTHAGYPFGPGTLVIKVIDKIFILINEHSDPLTINLKADPDDALALRAKYSAIQPGYHMNKRHWNTLTVDGTIPANLIYELIDESYALVVAGLPKRSKGLLKGDQRCPEAGLNTG